MAYPEAPTEQTSGSAPETLLAFGASVVVHIVLGAAMVLAASRTPPEPPVVQAELWSSLPPLQPATANSPPPAAEAPAPESPDTPKLTLPDPGPSAADIALEKKKAEEARIEKETQQKAAEEKAAREKEAQAKAAAEKAAREKAARERAEKEKADLAEAAKQAKIAREEAARELKKREEEERLAKKRAEEEKRRQEAKLKKALEAQRREQEEAIFKGFGSDPKAKAADAGKDRTTKAGVAGGAELGDRTGVLADYSAAIRARIRARITFDPARAPNNPEAIFEVTQLSTGQISKVTLKKSSGNPAWDSAVERAIQASTPLPKAADGSVEPLLILSFRPQDPR
ncbi:MAG: cell envelope integrity protein TolA [Burkholderiaceae bacterium]